MTKTMEARGLVESPGSGDATDAMEKVSEGVWNKLRNKLKLKTDAGKELFKSYFPNIVYYATSDMTYIDPKRGHIHNLAVFVTFIMKFIRSLTSELVKRIIRGITKPVSTLLQAGFDLVLLIYQAAKAILWTFRYGKLVQSAQRITHSNRVHAAFVLIRWIVQDKEEHLESSVLRDGLSDEHQSRFSTWYNRSVDIEYRFGVYGKTGMLHVSTNGEKYITKRAIGDALTHHKARVTGIIFQRKHIKNDRIKDHLSHIEKDTKEWDRKTYLSLEIVPLTQIDSTVVVFQGKYIMHDIVNEFIYKIKECRKGTVTKFDDCVHSIRVNNFCNYKYLLKLFDEYGNNDYIQKMKTDVKKLMDLSESDMSLIQFIELLDIRINVAREFIDTIKRKLGGHSPDDLRLKNTIKSNIKYMKNQIHKRTGLTPLQFRRGIHKFRFDNDVRTREARYREIYRPYIT